MEKQKAVSMASWLSVEIKRASLDKKNEGSTYPLPVTIQIPSALVEDVTGAIDELVGEAIQKEGK